MLGGGDVSIPKPISCRTASKRQPQTQKPNVHATGCLVLLGHGRLFGPRWHQLKTEQFRLGFGCLHSDRSEDETRLGKRFLRLGRLHPTTSHNHDVTGGSRTQQPTMPEAVGPAATPVPYMCRFTRRSTLSALILCRLSNWNLQMCILK